MRRMILRSIAASLVCSALFASEASAFYQQPASKKGLLISSQESNMLADLSELGISQAICNIGTDQPLYTYNPLADYCASHGITMTMIVINRKGAGALLPSNDEVQGVGAQGTYGFNVLTDAGKEAVRNYAKSIAAQYADRVSNWVIGNEVNDAVAWDYNGIMDMHAHADTYAESFRIFYEEIKKANPEAHVLIPLNMIWNGYTTQTGYYNVKDYLPLLNEKLKDLDYGIAWHAYPVNFFHRPEFLDDAGITQDLNTPNINLANIQVLTNYLQNADMLSPNGKVRHLLLTEQGFTSACEDGENRQAAAIRQAYEIASANPYIEGFYLSRQVDAKSQAVLGGAFGLWTRDSSAAIDETAASKKQSWYVYQSLK